MSCDPFVTLTSLPSSEWYATWHLEKVNFVILSPNYKNCSCLTFCIAVSFTDLIETILMRCSESSFSDGSHDTSFGSLSLSWEQKLPFRAIKYNPRGFYRFLVPLSSWRIVFGSSNLNYSAELIWPIWKWGFCISNQNCSIMSVTDTAMQNVRHHHFLQPVEWGEGRHWTYRGHRGSENSNTLGISYKCFILHYLLWPKYWSHSATFVHILPQEKHKAWFLRKMSAIRIIKTECLRISNFFQIYSN
jgi:hypothetical protein